MPTLWIESPHVLLTKDEYLRLVEIEKKYYGLLSQPAVKAIDVPIGPGDGLVRPAEEKPTYYKSSSYPWKCAVKTCPNPIYYSNTDEVKICTSCHRNGVTPASLKATEKREAERLQDGRFELGANG